MERHSVIQEVLFSLVIVGFVYVGFVSFVSARCL